MGRAWSASFPRTSCRMRCPKWLRKPSSGRTGACVSYQGQGSFGSWLATIALRCCYERLRERYRPEASFSSLARGEEDEPEGLTDQASFRLYEEENERRDLREELESALQSLEPRDRMLLTLTFLEGYSIAETAAMMDMTPINVRVRVHRSKAKLREALDPPLESLGRQS